MNDSSLTNWNPPGLSALAYRISDYTTAKQRILESLYIPLLPEQATLAALKTRDRDDLSIALIDAWAMIIDVLTFYQERIANEGFWRTATERRSLLELARTIGCELDPGVAASTYLVFTVEPTAPKIVTVAAGTAIASIPGENEQSQTFETSEPLIAHLDWNAISPRLSRPQTITPQTNQLYLQGLDLQLQVGDRLLLIDEDPPKYQYLLKLTAVELLTEQQQTRITWEAQTLGAGSPRRPRLFAFRQRVGRFGNLAPKWDTLPDEIKRNYSAIQGGCFRLVDHSWVGISLGLPTIDIWCLTASENALFAGTNTRGIYRLLDNGASWQTSTIGLSNLAITALYYYSESVFAGSPGGGVFRSKDNGETWTAIGIGNIQVKPVGTNQIETINTGIPNTVVRAILAYTVNPTTETITSIETVDNVTIIHGERFRSKVEVGEKITIANNLYTVSTITSDTELRVIPASQGTPTTSESPPTTFTTLERSFLFVGTDNGVYRSSDQGQNWYARGLETVSVRALMSIASSDSFSLYAGTDQGVFRSHDHGNTWERKDLTQAITSFATLTLDGKVYLFAGTKSNGVYCAPEEGEPWQPSLSSQPIAALAVYETTLFAATTTGKVFTTQDAGDNWTEIDSETIATEITSLTVAQGSLIAGTRFAGFTAIDWSQTGEQVTSEPSDESFIDLDAVYPQILPNSWLVCLSQEHFQPIQVATVRTTIARGFTLEAQVSRVTPKVPQPIDHFRPQTTIVLAQSELLPFATFPLSLDYNHRSAVEQFQDPIGNDFIFLNQFVSGLQPGQKMIVTGKRPRVELHQVGGLFRRGDRWQRDNQGLTSLNVLSLTTTTQGNYFVGTDQGLFQRSNQQRWNAINTTHQPNSGISANLAIRLLHTVPARDNAQEAIFAGTEIGLLQSLDQGKTWKAIGSLTQIRAIVYSHASDNLFVATENSIFRSVNHGETWTPIDRDLIGVQVQCLSVDRSGVLFAGTIADGVWRSRNEGESWEWVGYSGRSGRGAITSLDTIVTGVGTLFSEQLKPGDSLIALGQTRTVVQLDQEHPNTVLTIDTPFNPPGLPEGTPFTLSTGLGSLNVTALAIDQYPGLIILKEQSGLEVDEQPGIESIIFAGTAGGGIWRSRDQGNHWESINQDLASFEITTLVAYAQPGIGRLELYGTTVRLSVKPIALRKGAAITIANETRIVTTEPQNLVVNGSIIIEFTINVEFSSTITNSENRAYTIPTLVAGTTSHGLFYSVDRGESWVSDSSGLTNTTIRAILPPTPKQADYLVGGTGILLSSDQRSYTAVSVGDSLQILACPVPETGTLKWQLRDVNGFKGVLETTTSEDFIVQPAFSDDETTSELVTLLTPPIDQQTPILVFQNPLQECYDPSTVAIHANVVAATHGETIIDTIEILGSGDGNLANQSFVLKKPPLTYIAQSGTIANTLEIRVNDLLWREVPALYNLKPDDQVYIVRTADNGTTSITFGDGITGARLPSGIDNVVATYRSGIGLSGNVAANKLSLLKSRSLGIQSVNNPLAATGGANPETREQIRDRAPLTIRTLDRIVSVRDFEDFTRTYSGIGKAQAISLWSARTKVVHLTIAGSEGATISPDSMLYQSLVQAIEQRRDPYQAPPIISSYERIEFDLEAIVLINSRYQAIDVQAIVETKLKETFAFVNRAFGQNVTAAEIIALIQSIEGVVAVDLEALHRVDRPKTLEHSLTASSASWNPDTQFAPAQLLVLHNIKLTTQSITP